MSQKSSSKSGGIGFASLLTVAFICLKLMGHITWSWLWVLSPMWLPAAFFLSIIAACFIVYVVFGD